MTTQLDDVEGRRGGLVEAIPDDLLATYDGMRRRLGGVAVAHLNGNRCDGCHLAIPSAELEAVKRTPPDQAAYCPECTRILVR